MHAVFDPRAQARLAALALALALMFVSLHVYARVADIGELGLSMNLPDTLDVFTRTMREGDPLPGLYGTTAEAVRADLKARRLWLEARDIAGKYVITLEAQSDFGLDYAALPDEEIQGLAPGGETFRTRQAAFVLYEQGGALVCVTRTGGKLFTLRLIPAERLSGGMRDTLRSVARGLDFGLGQ